MDSDTARKVFDAAMARQRLRVVLCAKRRPELRHGIDRMNDTPVMRAQIVSEVSSWIGTPYRHQASLKGVGCDCLGLIRGVWRELFGAEPERPTAYTPDWAEASGEETFAAAARRHLRETAIGAAEPGDVLLFRWRSGLPAKHAGVLIAPHRFVHAHQGAVVSVAAYSRWWRERTTCAFRFPLVVD